MVKKAKGNSENTDPATLTRHKNGGQAAGKPETRYPQRGFVLAEDW